MSTTMLQAALEKVKSSGEGDGDVMFCRDEIYFHQAGFFTCEHHRHQYDGGVPDCSKSFAVDNVSHFNL